MNAVFKMLAILVLIIALRLVSADSPNFGALNSDDGLPGFTVWDITQDETGYLWIATVDGLARFDGYAIEVFRSSDGSDTLQDNVIRVLHIDAQKTLWVGTNAGGLARRNDDGSFKNFQYEPLNDGSLNSNQILSLAGSADGKLWVGTNKGLNLFDKSTNKFKHFIYDADDKNSLPNSTIRALLVSKSGELWVGSYAGLSLYDAARQTFQTFKLESDTEPKVISLHEAADNSLWVGTHSGLYQFNPRTRTVTKPIAELVNKIVVSIETNAQGAWFGTLDDGLFRLKDDGKVVNYSYQRNESSIADNVIMSLFTDRGGVLWIGTFQDGLSTLELSSLAFGRHDDSPGSVHCMTSRTVYGLLAEADQILWIGTDKGVVRFNRDSKECTLYPTDRSNSQALAGNAYSLLRSSNGLIWVATAGGLNLLNESTSTTDRLDGQIPAIPTRFIIEKDPNTLLVGTEQGLYQYDLISRTSHKVRSPDNDLIQSKFNNYAKDNKGTYWFGTAHGIATLDTHGNLELLRREGESIVPAEVSAIYIAPSGIAWAGLRNMGLWVLDQGGKVIRKYDNDVNFSEGLLIGGILADQRNNLWVSTQEGITKIGADGEIVRTYTSADGLQSNLFNNGSAFAASNGELFFGGRRGFNAFFPEDITSNILPPTVVLTNLRLDNQIVTPGLDYKGFSLSTVIDKTDEIQLRHNHKMFSIEFAALDFASPSLNQYAYKLDGFDTEWRNAPAAQRRATYTNLNPGRYTFRVRAASKDGVWNDHVKTLKIDILPAMWATWWAKTFYMIFALILLYTVFQIRNRTQRKRAAELESEVLLRTQEVEQQKITIEQMLARKNSLFENVSHEFRTPLTLLIGPLKEVRQELTTEKQAKNIDLALANANRLLHMVEQLLNLAESDQSNGVQKQARAIAPALQMIVASFSHAAKQNNLNLKLESMPDVAVDVSSDALEVIFGNLISNALKFSHRDGEIIVSVRAILDQVEICVTDDGPGIAIESIQKIFDRFTRLTEHMATPGTGLGLAVTKELVEANGGTIVCRSELGKGASFIVTLPISDSHPDYHLPQSTTAQIMADGLSAHAPVSIQSTSLIQDENMPTVLVIDDNAELISYIGSILSPQFQFIGATSGHEGITVAQEIVPDLIISDVMMPGLDGFEVSKILRNQATTCHIPIILLTARGDRSSRLRGWQESVDEFLQKPFDAEELLARISNLLRIRKLLGEKLGKRLVKGSAVDATSLSAKDRVFVEKLTKVVGNNFQDANFTRAKFAALLAMSERQLQRKLKSITNCNPALFLRDYRLNKAIAMLEDGQSIGLVAGDCGFASASYFTKCFREKFAMPPTQYQESLNKKGRGFHN